MRYILIAFLTCCPTFAQTIYIGAIGGGRITGDVLPFPAPAADSASAASAFRAESRFYVVGPTIEIGLPHRLAVEFDALYHRQGFFDTFYHDTLYYTSRERDNTWEFPTLLKYTLPLSAVHPFIEAGVAPRTMTGSATTAGSASYSPSLGFATGAGLQFNRGPLLLTPQVRYTRRATAPVSGLYYSLGSTYSSNRNQFDLLVGINWKLK